MRHRLCLLHPRVALHRSRCRVCAVGELRQELALRRRRSASPEDRRRAVLDGFSLACRRSFPCVASRLRGVPGLGQRRHRVAPGGVIAAAARYSASVVRLCAGRCATRAGLAARVAPRAPWGVALRCACERGRADGTAGERWWVAMRCMSGWAAGRGAGRGGPSPGKRRTHGWRTQSAAGA